MLEKQASKLLHRVFTILRNQMVRRMENNFPRERRCVEAITMKKSFNGPPVFVRKA